MVAATSLLTSLSSQESAQVCAREGVEEEGGRKGGDAYAKLKLASSLAGVGEVGSFHFNSPAKISIERSN